MSKPTLAESAIALAAILSSIVQMSDGVEKAASIRDAQHKLLAMQKSIQTNAERVRPYVAVVIESIETERKEPKP